MQSPHRAQRVAQSDQYLRRTAPGHLRGTRSPVGVPRRRSCAAASALAGGGRIGAGRPRTTLDVLNAHQDLIAARARLILVGSAPDRSARTPAHRESAAWTPKTLGLATPDYPPEVLQPGGDAWGACVRPSGQ